MATFKENFKKFKDRQGLQIMKALLAFLFRILGIFYTDKKVNFPEKKCVFALWHAHQCGVFSCKSDRNVCIMVSSSKDGEIISHAANTMGVETVRGSKTRGGARASFELIKKIKNENVNGAITIDGPKGPNRIVKKGIIDIAKMAEVPVVPAVWWSPQKIFLKFKSWDEFRFPLIGTKLLLLCGDPIEVPQDIDEVQTEIIRKKIEDELNRLYVKVKEIYKEYY